MKTKIYLPDVVGKGYGSFWHYKGRYRVVKGSRASKKSKTTALWLIWALMKYPESNALCVRRYSTTLRDSVFSDLKWAIHKLGVDAFWNWTVSPMEITYVPTGQKILFRGLDDGLKITSISVDKGVLCFVWVEEAFEITNENDFNKLDLSIRGEVPTGLFKQITMTFNPWSEYIWIKRRFFDVADDDILAITTTWECNEWLDKADRKIFLKMKKNNPRRYRVEGDGEWGIAEGLIYERVKVEDFDVSDILKKADIKSAFGLDFGYTNDETALFCGLIDLKNKKIYVFDELYEKGLSNEKIFENVYKKGYLKEKIIADSAEPKSIARLRDLGLKGIRPARKGRDSVKNGIDFISDFDIVVKPRCTNFLKEIRTYSWQQDKSGRWLNIPIDDFNHLMDAMRYALEDFARPKNFG